MQTKVLFRHRGPAMALIATIAIIASGCGSGSAARAGGPQVKIIAPQTGATVQGNVVSLQLASTGLTIVKADGNTSGTTGHYHVFVDKDPPAIGAVIPKEPGITHTADNPVKLTGLTVGQHRIVVVLGDGAHHRLNAAAAETTVTVNGPSLQASAPATVSKGDPVTVTVTVSGVTLVTADGDTSGKTGHLHFFVDKTPTPIGQPIPKEPGITHTAKTSLTIPDLAPGAHVIWVVLGNGAHLPLDPPVEDKVTVTVA